MTFSIYVTLKDRWRQMGAPVSIDNILAWPHTLKCSLSDRIVSPSGWLQYSIYLLLSMVISWIRQGGVFLTAFIFSQHFLTTLLHLTNHFHTMVHRRQWENAMLWDTGILQIQMHQATSSQLWLRLSIKQYVPTNAQWHYVDMYQLQQDRSHWMELNTRIYLLGMMLWHVYPWTILQLLIVSWHQQITLTFLIFKCFLPLLVPLYPCIIFQN